jgi:hypothetical protein
MAALEALRDRLAAVGAKSCHGVVKELLTAFESPSFPLF